jgi:hypothetical protein
VGADCGNYPIKEVPRTVRNELENKFDVMYIKVWHPSPWHHVDIKKISEIGFESEPALREKGGKPAAPLQRAELGVVKA